jgi:hypothetical protein
MPRQPSARSRLQSERAYSSCARRPDERACGSIEMCEQYLAGRYMDLVTKQYDPKDYEEP